MAAKLYRDLTSEEKQARDTELKDIARGATYSPFDLLGAPVDIINMAMGAVGVPVSDKPFLGSEYLIDKYADLGEAIGVDYQRPTGSSAETTGRIIAGMAGLGGEAAVLAPGIGKLFARTTKTRGSGTEIKGSGAAELEAPSTDLGPLVREAGSDGFVPLEKTVGAPGTPGVERNINPALQEDVFVPGSNDPLGGIDYLPAAQALLENPPGMSIGKKGLTGAQYLARLKNQPSVTDAELEVSGLDKFLAENANRKIPVDDVLDFHMGNSPRIRVTEFAGGDARYADTQRINNMPPGLQIYEELVFFDDKVTTDPALAPARNHEATHHTDVDGSIGHIRQSYFEDPLNGGKPATIGEENQQDLLTVLSRKKRAEAEGGTFGRDFVELSPQLVDKFKKYEEAFEADAQVKTLPDINNRLLEQQTKARSLQADVEENRRLATSKRARYLTLGDTAKIDKAVIDLMDERVPPTDKLMARYDLTDMTRNALKGELFMQMRQLKDSGLSDDAIKAITEFGARKGVTKDLGPSFDDFKKNNEAILKELAGINPDARVIGDPNALRLDISEAASLAVNKEKFDTVAELALTMANRAAEELVSPAVANPKFLQAISDVVPNAIKDINVSNIRKDFDEYADMTAKTRRLREDANNAAEDARKINEERSEIVGQTLDRVAGNDRAAYEQYRYETKKSGVLPKDDIEFVPNNPFKTQSQASRYQLHQAIKKAAQDGSHRYYFPDYEDIAALREEKADLFKTTYKDVPNKVIKELKAMYPDMEVGVVNPADIGNIGQSDIPMLKAKKPMRYIDLTPLQGKSAQVRRYKDGGKVDLRSGIGDIFKVYS